MPNPDAESRRAVYVLDADPDLGADLDAAALARARDALVAPVATLGADGRDGLGEVPGRAGALGLLVLDGVVFREVRLLGTSSAELLGRGDLLRPWDADTDFLLPVAAQVEWTVLAPLEAALLDRAFVRRAAEFPDVVARLAERTVGRAKALALHEAVTNLKHVETRLLVQFWHIAERWGRVDADGISIRLALTHAMLGKLVGATRPTVTTALGRLARDGDLVGSRGEWRLSQRSRARVSDI